MKFESIVGPNIFHDIPNILTELVLINSSNSLPTYSWRHTDYKKFWGKTVSVIKKINKLFDISYEQLAFYIYYCKPKTVDSKEFGKMAIVAKKFFPGKDIGWIVEYYRNKFKISNDIVQDINIYNGCKPIEHKTKSLAEFIKELESEEIIQEEKGNSCF